MLATQLGFKLTEVRKNGTVPWLRPDGKTQVTCEYKKEGTFWKSFFITFFASLFFLSLSDSVSLTLFLSLSLPI